MPAYAVASHAVRKPSEEQGVVVSFFHQRMLEYHGPPQEHYAFDAPSQLKRFEDVQVAPPLLFFSIHSGEARHDSEKLAIGSFPSYFAFIPAKEVTNVTRLVRDFHRGRGTATNQLYLVGGFILLESMVDACTTDFPVWRCMGFLADDPHEAQERFIKESLKELFGSFEKGVCWGYKVAVSAIARSTLRKIPGLDRFLAEDNPFANVPYIEPPVLKA